MGYTLKLMNDNVHLEPCSSASRLKLTLSRHGYLSEYDNLRILENKSVEYEYHARGEEPPLSSTDYVSRIAKRKDARQQALSQRQVGMNWATQEQVDHVHSTLLDMWPHIRWPEDSKRVS